MTERLQPDACLQARTSTAEAAHKKSEAELALLRPQAASLEQQLSQSQVKLKAAQADVTNLRAEALQNKVSFQPIKSISMQMPRAWACVAQQPGVQHSSPSVQRQALGLYAPKDVPLADSSLSDLS